MLMLSLDSSAKSAAVGVTNGEKVLASGFEIQDLHTARRC